MFASHRKQLCAMAQGAKRDQNSPWRRKWKARQPLGSIREAGIQARIIATFSEALGFTPSSKKVLRPPAIIDY
jgi:hypothetical protein